MNRRLPPGHFYGRILNKREIAGFTLSESAYLPNTRIAEHSHEYSYFCILLQGTYRESYDHKIRECKPSTVVFHPPHEVHANHFWERGGRLFRLEIKQQWLERVREYPTALSDPADFNGGSLAWLTAKLYKEFRQMDDVSPLVIEGLVLEVVAELSRQRRSHRERQPPLWLEQAREMLHAQFAENLVFTSLADSIGRHPVHCARTFRRFYGCTIAEYVRRLRIEAASRQLVDSNMPLSLIAAACGFSDQSHFSKTFKHATGMTPAQYRASFRSR